MDVGFHGESGSRSDCQTVANDVVDDARSGIECAKGVIVEQRIT
jgi:hypothetical protein